MKIWRFLVYLRKSSSVFARAVLVLSLAFCAVPAHAAEVPRFDQPVLLKAREQPINLFVRELFGKIRVPVQIDPSLRGSVNGDFKKTAREVFDDLSASFYLTLYYDGAVAHVYPANDIERKVMYVPKKIGQQVVDNARNMSLVDPQNLVSVSGAGLVVTGTRRFVEQIEELSAALRKGIPVAPGTPDPTPVGDTYRVFKLKYAWADDVTLSVGGQEVVIPGVASMLRRVIEPGMLDLDAPVAARMPRATKPGLRGKGLQSVGNKDPQSDPRALQANSSSPTQGSGVQNGDFRSTSVANTRIVADSRQNALIIRDRAERMASYEQLIRSLDVEPAMVEIEATIIDMDTDRLRELGVNWRVQNEDFEALLDEGNARDTLLRPNVSGAASGVGGVVSLVLGNQTKFISRIRALETQGAARIVSKPHVITLSNVEALLDTTSTFFVRVAGQEEVDLFNVSVGTTLRVTPHVVEGADKPHIKLLVTIQDGSTSDETVDAIPVIESSSINTQALVSIGESLLIGGLVREITSNTTSKVPLLGSIPGIGALFRSNGKRSARIERLFLITPRLTTRPNLEDAHRLSVPYLSGSESEIVSSNAGRLDDVNAGLAARDAGRPLVQPLPAGRADVALTREGVEPAVQSTQPVAAPEPVRRSIRERLLRLPPGTQAAGFSGAPEPALTGPMPGGQPASGQGVIITPANVAEPMPENTGPGEPVVGSGWQAVRAPEPPAAKPNVLVPATFLDPSHSPVPLDTDWQKVSN